MDNNIEQNHNDQEPEVTVIKETFTVSNAMYKNVSKDLRKMSGTLIDPAKAANAHNIASRIGDMNEKSPGSKMQQDKIMDFSRQTEIMKAKQRNKELGNELEM